MGSESTFSSDSCSSINPGSVEPQDIDDCAMNQMAKSVSPNQHDYLPFYNLCPSQVIFTSNASTFDTHPAVCNKSIPVDAGNRFHFMQLPQLELLRHHNIYYPRITELTGTIKMIIYMVIRCYSVVLAMFLLQDFYANCSCRNIS
uniref:Uncharacterized protein n=1 Tax=Anopheles culicifacies TaxID=139723 RepID=A0A182M8I4_9DIPT